MAGTGGGMTVLPQYQGNYYDLQRQQALAQALMQSSLQPQQIQATGSGPYTVMPKYSIGGGLAQLGQALLSAKMANNVSQGMNNLGQQQWQAFGGGVPSSDTGQASSSQAALAQGAQNGSVGPTNANADLLSSQQQSPQSQAPQSSVSPMNPLGMNPALAYMGYSADPGKYFETQAALYKPTDATLMAQQAGVDPRAANLGALAKANSLAMRPNGGVLNMQTGQVTTMPASAEPGHQNIQGADGRWYQVQTGGGLNAVLASNAAGAIGKAYGTTTTGYQNGQPVFLNAGKLAADTAGGMTGAPGSAAPGTVTNAGQFGGYQSPNSAMPSPSLPPGSNTLAEGSAQSFNGLRQQAATTPNAVDAYNKAEQALLTGVTTGPGSTLGTNIIGRLNTAGIPIMKGDTTGYQSLQKFLSNAAAQAASAGGFNGSDARFEAFAHGQPNAETMNPDALRYAIQYVRGQQAGVQAKYQAAQAFLNQQGGNTLNYPQFEAKWNQAYSPDVMLVKAMPNPADQQAYLADLKKQGKLGDWMNHYQQMQSMGAW